MNKCTFDPLIYANAPIGMFHCPECGEMVCAGIPHPDYSLLENIDESEESLCENCDPWSDYPLCNKCNGC